MHVLGLFLIHLSSDVLRGLFIFPLPDMKTNPLQKTPLNSSLPGAAISIKIRSDTLIVVRRLCQPVGVERSFLSLCRVEARAAFGQGRLFFFPPRNSA